MHRRLALCVMVSAVAAIVALGGVKPAYSAVTTTVNCAVDSSALAGALATASDGDTLVIQGTCKGTFEISHNLMLASIGGAILDGQGAGTVLTIDPGKTVSISNLTITGGSDSTAGGIRNAGRLTLENSTVSGNSASVPQFQNGVGGILNQGVGITITNSTVSGNSATSSMPFNTAVGGILTSAPATLTLTSSTVSGNSASTQSDAFGGILSSAPGSVVTITNSTVSGNSASAPGGASAFSIAVGGVSNSGGSLTVTNSTLSGNSVSEPNGGFLPPVGGMSNVFGGTLTVANSLISSQSGGPNCFGLTASSDGGYNLDDGTSCGFSAANHSLSSTNPLLDPAGLKDNGGPTQTIALVPGSPVIDAIPSGINSCGAAIATDQRGVTRPQGTGCELGAFELMQKTPAQLLADLAILVNGVGPGTSLADKVKQAQAYLRSGDVSHVCSTLSAFINEVAAQKGKTVNPPSFADDLIAQAQGIKTLLGC